MSVHVAACASGTPFSCFARPVALFISALGGLSHYVHSGALVLMQRGKNVYNISVDLSRRVIRLAPETLIPRARDRRRKSSPASPSPSPSPYLALPE